ncbi:hypothetical protein PG987_005976 [Apiospora arundinis]
MDYAAMAVKISLEPRCIRVLSQQASRGSSYTFVENLPMEDDSHSIFAQHQNENPGDKVHYKAQEIGWSLQIPISPSAIRNLMDLGCGPVDRRLGLEFLDRFQHARRGDYQTQERLGPVGGQGAYGTNRDVFEVAKVLFAHGFSVPLVPDKRSEICKANFGHLFRPHFGADGVAELSEIRRRLQEQISWTSRLTRAFGVARTSQVELLAWLFNGRWLGKF